MWLTNKLTTWTNLYPPTPLPKPSLFYPFLFPNHPFDFLCLWLKSSAWKNHESDYPCFMAAHVQNFCAVHNLPCFTLFSCITGAASLFGNIECHVLKWPDKTFAYFANRKNKTMERILNNSSWIDWLNIRRVVLLISSKILSALFYSAYLATFITYS